MEDVKAQLSEKLRSASNILVTVSSNPSVDQLAACIGMTLWLNKLGKHATAVFSGEIPNALEFLQPEATIEKNTDSLRDFIIALDKSKADKLRYKVEDRVVKIFITPYRTSLSADDLEFSQGDFNVDAIIAIGVTKQTDLDTAITAHGRILHDATVTTINTTSEGDIGSINWQDTTASSLSELVYDLCQMLDPSQLDPQIATALLTGIVAETNRFSNNKTSPNTMSVAATLMGAGANQQLVANKLEEAKKIEVSPSSESNEQASDKSSDGTLEISHDQEVEQPEPITETKEEEEKVEQSPPEEQPDEAATKPSKHSVIEPSPTKPTFTANAKPDDLEVVDEQVSDPLSLPQPIDNSQLLDHDQPSGSANALNDQPLAIPTEQPPAGSATKVDAEAQMEDKDKTLEDIEEAVHSPHLDSLRDKVNDALAEPTPTTTPAATPEESLDFKPSEFEISGDDNLASESGLPLNQTPPLSGAPASDAQAMPASPPALDNPLPTLTPLPQVDDQAKDESSSGSSPPPVPPPLYGANNDLPPPPAQP